MFETTKKPKPDHEWHSRQLRSSVSLGVPAVRMVGLMVAADDGQSWVWRYPVVALAASIEQSWGKRLPAGQHMPPPERSAEAYEEAGWVFEHESLDVTPQVIDINESWDVVGWGYVLMVSNAVFRLITCPWPVEEDDARLGPIEEEMRAEALKKFGDRKAIPDPKPESGEGVARA